MDKYNTMTISFYSIYYDLFMTDNEKYFISNLIDIIDNYGIENFADIYNAKILIYTMKDHYLFPYKISLLAYIKSDLINKIFNYAGINKSTFLNKDNISRSVLDLNILLTDELTYLNAFPIVSINNDILKKNPDDNLSYIRLLFDDPFNTSNIRNTNVMKNSWYDATLNEIIERFKLLTYHFGENVLLSMGIKKISRNNVLNMNFKKIIKYYNNIIIKIRKYLKRYSNFCDAFTDIDEGYVTCLKKFLSSSEIITDGFYTNKYDIIIENNDNTSSSSSK